MPYAGPSRRAVLAGASAVLLAGCTGRGSPEPPRPDPDDAVREQVSADVQRLVALYAATSTRHPSLRRRLDPLAAEHTAHLAALAGGRPRATPAPVTSSPSSAGTSSAGTSSASSAATASSRPSASPPAVPPSPGQARSLLVRAERDGAAQRVIQSAAASPTLARLVAAIGASEAAHAALLRGAG